MPSKQSVFHATSYKFKIETSYIIFWNVP